MDAMKAKSLLKNEGGSVAAIALILLLLLTVMGIAVSTTSTIGLQIAGNQKFYKENLYLAEAAALEYAQEMEDDNDLEDNSEILSLSDAFDVHNETHWTTYSTVSNVHPNAEYVPKYEGIAPGASLDMTKPTVHEYGIYARCQRKGGLTIVKVGYRKAY